ncbi:hypothetical protein AM2_082 [Lactococcus phage AM2]|uniref:Uncharacterized protein n=7 Tax=Audreyjarvisvirus AM1 TaxID=2845188 RepID=A0A1W6JLP2_9CAUD|nr:hypothetical protein H1Z30_gp083 [Lactococcus phage AM1]ARM66387.1 hypothetical protein AM2_082 [Lactococcus phage AM2]ARM66564.1 hypothetical protein AM3_082 [Lactococcus phage AM3]ARM67117.1 hypothetical protein AM8_082 [Lactococcus phage AM8]ARM67296.1 hypothetical protein AM9_083 [Lactococcus phage AM9]ARM67474.1 hypothetical protein AM11_082 [Lactococcus phage AM11]ARQ95662.1 hypothetical protein AM12_083 [Lactococcus phage AM12]
MKKHIVVIDEFHEDNTEKLKNINNVKESIELLSDSFVEVAGKMKELADSLRSEPVDVYDPLADKRKKEQSFKNGVGNLKHIKKRGGK